MAPASQPNPAAVPAFRFTATQTATTISFAVRAAAAATAKRLKRLPILLRALRDTASVSRLDVSAIDVLG